MPYQAERSFSCFVMKYILLNIFVVKEVFWLTLDLWYKIVYKMCQKHQIIHENFVEIYKRSYIYIYIYIHLYTSLNTWLEPLVKLFLLRKKGPFRAYLQYHGYRYNDVIMSAIAYEITGVSIGCSAVCSGADQNKHQSSASLVFVRGFYRWPVSSPHKSPVTQKMFPFDDVIMVCSNPLLTDTTC